MGSRLLAAFCGGWPGLLLRGLAGFAAAAASLALRSRLPEWLAVHGRVLGDLEYQAFLDHYPVSKFYLDGLHNGSQWGVRKATRPPRLIRLFDWRVRVGGMPEFAEVLDDREGDDPRTVLTGMDSVLHVVYAARSWATRRNDRVLVMMGMSGLTWPAFGGSEEVRSALSAELWRLFSRIYTVGNDHNASRAGFRTMPLGLVEPKVRKTNRLRPGAASAVAAIASARLDDAAKPFLILAAFGAMSESFCAHNGPLKSFDNVKVTSASSDILAWSEHPFYGSIPVWYPRRSHQAGQVPKAISRHLANRWLATPGSHRLGVSAGQISNHEWWPQLARYRFMMSPMGDEIQSPKNVEALLVLTVPILQRGPYRVADDLLGLGFPLVVIDEWEELSPGNLSHWWQMLSPRLLSFRANCLTTDAFYRIVTGGIESCH